MNESYSPDWLVVIGSSAGGIESLSRLVTSLPDDFPVPIIIAQHLHPERTSHLREILQARSPLPVHVIEGKLDLEPGTIFIAGPNTHIEITDHAVHEVEDSGERPMPSVDLLFRTATVTFGERLIAVILSGTGSDGALGASVVKDAGGTVIIENPQTSAFPQMALSIPPTIVDFSVELEAIGPLLSDLVTGAYEFNPQDRRTDVDRLLTELHQRSGIDFGRYKAPTIMRCIQRRLVATQSHDFDEYVEYLSTHPEEFEILSNSFLIKVTEFFRDPELFQCLLNGGLQPVLERALETGELRIWSAGCATGEEAYSMAIVIHELLGDELSQINVRVFGTDVDHDAITYARQGVYPAASLANLSDELRTRYFIRLDGFYEVRKSIRSLVVFGEHDLGQRSPFPRIDVALCRNVLIYFTGELQRRALQLFAFALRDNGLLILGKAETVTPLSEYFSLLDSQLKIYRRTGSHVAIPPGRFSDGSPVSSRSSAIPVLAPLQQTSRLRRRRADHTTPAARFANLQTALNALSVGIIIVDPDYRIAFATPTGRTYLGIHSAAVGDDLMHVTQHAPLTMLRNAVDSAFRGESTTVTYPVDVQIESDSEARRRIELSCFPLESSDGDDAIGYAIIQTGEITTLYETQQELAETTERLQRLTNAHRSLETANERLAVANKRLQANNEELLISNEEFQAAAEEVETLNEELHATNEELETLNEELHATIEELQTTNEELQARSREMEHLAADREEQRRQARLEQARLEAVLGSMAEAVILVDEQGVREVTNAAFRTLFGDDGARLQPVDLDGCPLPFAEWPQQRAALGEFFTMRFTALDSHSDRHTFEASGQPVSEESDVRGGVVVIREIPGDQ